MNTVALSPSEINQTTLAAAAAAVHENKHPSGCELNLRKRCTSSSAAGIDEANHNQQRVDEGFATANHGNQIPFEG